jgi:hypothetical protein|tara:strand:- start:336 stop:587 length:252 start_codon:yes stop_codon:yes gene_type:complete
MTKYDIVQHLVNSYRIVEDINLTETESYEKVRSWKERLFTFPWKPLQKVKVCHKVVPSKEVFVTDNMLVCHPFVAQELRKLPF